MQQMHRQRSTVLRRPKHLAQLLSLFRGAADSAVQPRIQRFEIRSSDIGMDRSVHRTIATPIGKLTKKIQRQER